jgi:hypothetical protein
MTARYVVIAAVALLMVGYMVFRLQRRDQADRKEAAKVQVQADARREHDELITITPEGPSGAEDGDMTWPIRVTNNGDAELREVRLVTSFEGQQIDGTYPVDIGSHEPTVFQVHVGAIYNIAVGGPDSFPHRFGVTVIARDGRLWERPARPA